MIELYSFIASVSTLVWITYCFFTMGEDGYRRRQRVALFFFVCFSFWVVFFISTPLLVVSSEEVEVSLVAEKERGVVLLLDEATVVWVDSYAGVKAILEGRYTAYKQEFRNKNCFVTKFCYKIFDHKGNLIETKLRN